jgi:EF-P beta-lysylation protein EpmB
MESWQTVLRTNFTRMEPLCDFLELSPEDRKALSLKNRFVLNVPYRLAKKMAKGTLQDPLLRQFVPLMEEKIVQEGFFQEPVKDTRFAKSEKLIQKYQGRSLIISTSACAMHCRYCFRQNFPYETERKGFAAELQTLEQDPSIKEVILSGGDPLSLPTPQLASLLHALDALPHLKRIRFHTRFPIGIPERIDAEFLTLLASLTKQVWFVIHANHPLELDEEVLAALKSIQKLGIPVLNQAVLLKGVNDNLETLQALSDLLADNGILFYYLHQLDRVSGAQHFEVDPEIGKQLITQLHARASGYQVPKFVQEIPGEPGKTSL